MDRTQRGVITTFDDLTESTPSESPPHEWGAGQVLGGGDDVPAEEEEQDDAEQDDAEMQEIVQQISVSLLCDTLAGQAEELAALAEYAEAATEASGYQAKMEADAAARAEWEDAEQGLDAAEAFEKQREAEELAITAERLEKFRKMLKRAALQAEAAAAEASAAEAEEAARKAEDAARKAEEKAQKAAEAARRAEEEDNAKAQKKAARLEAEAKEAKEKEWKAQEEAYRAAQREKFRQKLHGGGGGGGGGGGATVGEQQEQPIEVTPAHDHGGGDADEDVQPPPGISWEDILDVLKRGGDVLALIGAWLRDNLWPPLRDLFRWLWQVGARLLAGLGSLPWRQWWRRFWREASKAGPPIRRALTAVMTELRELLYWLYTQLEAGAGGGGGNKPKKPKKKKRPTRTVVRRDSESESDDGGGGGGPCNRPNKCGINNYVYRRGRKTKHGRCFTGSCCRRWKNAPGALAPFVCGFAKGDCCAENARGGAAGEWDVGRGNPGQVFPGRRFGGGRRRRKRRTKHRRRPRARRKTRHKGKRKRTRRRGRRRRRRTRR